VCVLAFAHSGVVVAWVDFMVGDGILVMCVLLVGLGIWFTYLGGFGRRIGWFFY